MVFAPFAKKGRVKEQGSRHEKARIESSIGSMRAPYDRIRIVEYPWINPLCGHFG
jgi:hypothetical protein